MKTLVLNAGSSSLKFSLFEDETRIGRGKIERLFFDPTLEIENKIEKVDVKSYESALQVVSQKLIELNYIENVNEIKYICHRVVHGGDFSENVKITDEVLKKIEECIPLAPLHNPANIETIKSAMKVFNATHFAFFDTSFHQSMPNRFYLYAIPYELNYRRYGFHGTSHKYVYNEAKNILKQITKKDNFNVVTIHLGNGSSMALISNDKVLHTTMGLTPLEGLVMGTRCGNIDPGIVIDLARKKGIDEVDRILNKESGFKGLTNYSDIREIIECAKLNSIENVIELYSKRNFDISKDSEKCKLAIIMLVDRIVQYLAWYEKIVEIDAIVFTAGIGEHIWQIRKLVAMYMKYEINDEKNFKNEKIINQSMPYIFVIPTDEEHQMIHEMKSMIKQ